MKVLLDNGHGENTPGKRSPKWSDGSQLFEWEYAREIAKGVYNQLRAKGIDAELLVKENIDVPLAERARRANEIAARYGKTKTLLVSIHCNASGTGNGTGWEIHTSPGKTKADDLAQVFWDMLIECLEELGKLEVIGRMGMEIGKIISTFSKRLHARLF